MHPIGFSGANHQQGFTLIEMVAVMVLLGLLSAGATLFIGDSVSIYQDNARRTELAQQGRFAIERMSRELRQALPNSIRVSGTCLEFTPIEAASTYVGQVADFQKTSLQAIDFNYPTTAVSGRRVAIYPNESRDVYNYSRMAVVDLNRVDAVSGSLRTVRFSNYSGIGQRFRSESPSGRFYIITQPVSYCVTGTQLRRHHSYGWLINQATDIATIGSGDILAEHVQLADAGVVNVFQYIPGVLQRSAVVSLDFRFSDAAASSEWLRFSHQVFVRNVP